MSASDAPVPTQAGQRSRSFADRAIASLPWVGLALAILTFFWIEAWTRKTPWLFTDELEWSQLSRAIADTGEAARRGEPIGFKSLYAYLIAPAWWLDSTAAAYSAIKYLNVVVMCLAAVPTYLLSRLLVARRVAVVVALLSIAIPAMSYTSSIVPEPLAYLWFCTGAWLAVRALARPAPFAVALAVAMAALGPLVRKQFVVLPVSLLLAAALVWVLSGRVSWRDRWRRIAAGVVVVAVAGLAFNWLVVQRIQAWTFSEYLNRHTFEEGAVAAGALAIGLGLLPVIGGLASLWLPERRGEPAYRAFAAYLAGSIAALGLYTAGKATYLAGVLTPLIEERNLFYLSPLLLLGTALVLTARRVDMRAVAIATAFVLVVVWSDRLVIGAPYFEAPGLAMPTLLNRNYRWDVNDMHLVYIGVAILAVVLILGRARRGVGIAAAVLLCAWMLTGQVYESRANNTLSDRFAQMLPEPRDWVDTATGGQPVTYLGREVTDGNVLWLTEFWNRSIGHVASIDNTAPGPGPAIPIGLGSTDGTLESTTGDRYVLADNGLELQAELVEERNGMRLYRTPGAWKVLDETRGVYSDGWAGPLTRYALLEQGGPGVMTVQLSRTAYNGAAPSGRATIRVGTVKLDEDGTPTLDRVLTTRYAIVPNGRDTKVRIPVESTPVAVVVEVTPTFREGSDPRDLAAQIAFDFERR